MPSPDRPTARPPGGLTFHLIPHTHWDREWYLTRSAFQARLVPVLDAVLEQLESDGTARFVLDGQTILLEDYLAIRPENEPRIAALVRRGGLEIGPWYVLSDLLIPSLASLRRNLSEGARDAARFGRRLDVLYSPDAFGHPAGLPGLAAEFGLRWAVIRRGLGRPGGKDRDLYRWESGGSSVLVYHLPAGGYDVAIELAEAGAELAPRWAPLRRELVERAGSTQIAVFLGADHHAMVPHVSGLREQLQALEPEDQVRISGLQEFFAAVEAARPDPPVLRGELRRSDGHSWVLQGVHATRSRLKRKQAGAELLLTRIAEPLAALAAATGGRDQSALLRAAWRTLLQSQFHDTCAGTTCDAVQKEQEVRLESVGAVCQEVVRESLAALRGPGAARPALQSSPAPRSLLLWNPSERTRAQITTAELCFFRRDVLVGAPSGSEPREGRGYRPFVLESASGERIPVQVLGIKPDQERSDAPARYPDQDEVDRVWVAFHAPAIGGLGTAELWTNLRHGTPAAAGLSATSRSLANRFLALELSPAGGFLLTDRTTGRRYPGLCALVDEPDQGDSYTFSRASDRLTRAGPPDSARVLAEGPLVAALETRGLMPAAGRGEIGIRLVLALYADAPLLRLRIELDNQAADHRLRLRFPLGAQAEAVAGTAFGVERRTPLVPQRRPNPLEQESATAPAHRFVAAADAERGLAIFAPGCFEYEWTESGELIVTLLRSVGALTRADLPERPGNAGWPLAVPEAEERGRHVIDLALAPLTAGDGAPERLERWWEEAFLPVQAYSGRGF